MKQYTREQLLDFLSVCATDPRFLKGLDRICLMDPPHVTPEEILNKAVNWFERKKFPPLLPEPPKERQPKLTKKEFNRTEWMRKKNNQPIPDPNRNINTASDTPKIKPKQYTRTHIINPDGTVEIQHA